MKGNDMLREKRLRRLGEQIERGEYRVDAQAVAQAVIERITVPDVTRSPATETGAPAPMRAAA